MKKIKSYTSIWSVEKVIYAINDFQLPFPLTFSQMAWFVVSLFVVILFGELPPFNMIDGAFLTLESLWRSLGLYRKRPLTEKSLLDS